MSYYVSYTMQHNSFHNAFSQKYLAIHRSYAIPKHPIVECFDEREVVGMQADEKLSYKTLYVSTEGTVLKLGAGNE